MHLKTAALPLCVCAILLLASPFLTAQTGNTKAVKTISSTAKHASAAPDVKELLESKIKTEWDAFKNRDKKAYSALLADDFLAIEDDGQGTRSKYAAASEVDRSVVSTYSLFAVKVIPLAPDAAFVTYEVTLQFPPKSAVRLKRVYVSELWLKRGGEWKARQYQETPVR
jgi:ketosteroid isomerase-like protein